MAKIHGIDYLLGRLRKFDKVFSNEVVRAVEISLDVVMQRAIELCKERVYDTPASPNYKRTGLLINSISNRLTGITGDKVSGEVFSAVFYAAFVELGTKYVDARPFLYPALVEKKDQVIKIMRKAFKKVGLMMGPAQKPKTGEGIEAKAK